jgi:hypothetical protein
LLTVYLKLMLLKLYEETKGRNNSEAVFSQIFFTCLSEMSIFLIEDTTTVCVWYSTDIFDRDNGFDMANLVLTVGSGCVVGLAMLG